MATITKEDINNMYPNTFKHMFIKTKDDNITYMGIINLMDNLIKEISNIKDIESKVLLIDNFIKLYKIYQIYNKGGGSNE